MSSDYIPGSCNIGKAEVKRRQIVAVFGLILMLISIVAITTSEQSRGTIVTGKQIGRAHF